MNWIAVGVYLIFTYLIVWLFDLSSYCLWDMPEYHQMQKWRVLIGGLFLLAMSCWGVGVMFK